MRARYKGPAGTGVVEVNDDASVQSLLDVIRSETGIQCFSIKYGPPMAMKTLDYSDLNQTARTLGLHGETLTIVPDQERSVSPIPTAPKISLSSQQQNQDSQRQSRMQSGEQPEDINVPWAEREGTLCKRKTLGMLPLSPPLTTGPHSTSGHAQRQ